MARTSLIGIMIAALIGLLLSSSAFAQDAATPAADKTVLTPYTFDGPFAPGPELCTATPISTDVAANLLATPVAVVEPILTSHGTVALPEGQLAGDEATTAIVETLTQLWACNNARNKAAILGLMTDEAIQNSFGNTSDTAWDMAELRANVAAALTPGEPRSADEYASIDGIASIVEGADGRIGVLVLNTDPNVADGRPVLDYFAFEQVDGVFKVADIVLDPFDLTPGYGFDAA